jgi:hypothetical protein
MRLCFLYYLLEFFRIGCCYWKRRSSSWSRITWRKISVNRNWRSNWKIYGWIIRKSNNWNCIISRNIWIVITIRNSCNIWLLIIIRERKWPNIFIKSWNNICYIFYLFLFLLLFLDWYNFLIYCCSRFLKIFTITPNIIILSFPAPAPPLLSLYLIYLPILYNLYNLLCSNSLFWLYLTHPNYKLF